MAVAQSLETAPAFRMMLIILIKQDDGHHRLCQERLTVQTMGHSKEEKEQNHARILDEAAAQIRALGLDGLSVSELMQSAGLTHGGFYRHFESRDQLLEVALARALEDGSVAVNAIARGPADPATCLARLIEAYLSEAHRDHVGASCAVSALAADVARAGEPLRSAYTDQVEAYLDVFARLIQEGKPRERRARAVLALSTVVGAILLARATNDRKLSSELLRSATLELQRALGVADR